MNDKLIEETIHNIVEHGKAVTIHLVQYDGTVEFTCDIGMHPKHPGNFLASSAKFDIRFAAPDILRLGIEQETIAIEILVCDAAIDNALDALKRLQEEQ